MNSPFSGLRYVDIRAINVFWGLIEWSRLGCATIFLFSKVFAAYVCVIWKMCSWDLVCVLLLFLKCKDFVFKQALSYSTYVIIKLCDTSYLGKGILLIS